MAKTKTPSNLILTELFLVKADWSRTYMGAIRRETDAEGNEIVLGSVIVNEGKIWSKASTQEELMKNMDAICALKLDMGLNDYAGVTYQIFGEDFFLN
jgi:fructose-bisphosphate aldolase class 1